MGDSQVIDNVTEWDLSAFMPKQQTSFRMSDGLPRPKVPLSTQSEDVYAKSSPNGMDFFNTPPSHSGEFNEEKFCTRANLDSRLRFLNQEFISLGFPTLFPKSVIAGRETEARFDLTQLVNCTYELLKTHNQHVKARDDLEAKHIRSESDNDVLLQSQSRLKVELEQAKREICVAQLREKKLAEQCNIYQQERKVEKEEMKKMKSDMQHKQKQFIHESKRREKEMHKLKDRLHQLLTDKNIERRMGMEILNAIQRPDGKRKMWKTGIKHDEEMYRLIISNYEERHKELTTEINLLRDYLADVQKELILLLNEKANQSEDEDENNDDDESGSALENGRYHMPFNVIGEDIKNNFRITWQQIKDKLERNSSKGSSPIENDTQNSEASNKEIADMKKQIEQYRSIINKQEQLLQSMQDDKMLDRIETYLRGDVSVSEEESLKEREKLLKSEREKLLKERKLTTELALKLAHDREMFEKERTEFYNHCISTPVIAKESAEDRKGRSHTHPRLKQFNSTPIFSPAPKQGVSSAGKSNATKTPTTGELYRYMSLATNDDENMREQNGSFLPKESDGETHGKKEIVPSASNNASANRGVLRTQRVAEHAENVRRVLETLPRRSFEEIAAM